MPIMMRKTALTLASLALATSLAACSNSLESTGSLPGDSSSSASATTTSASASPSPSSTSVAPSPSPTSEAPTPEPTSAEPTTAEATTEAPSPEPTSAAPTSAAPSMQAPETSQPAETQAAGAPNPAGNAALQALINSGEPVYAGAGGAVPAGATEATVSGSNGARLITTGQGFVRCDLNKPGDAIAVMCSTESTDSLVEKYKAENPQADFGLDSEYFMASTTKIYVDPLPGMKIQGDVFPSSSGSEASRNNSAQTIAYGNTVYYGNGACHAEPNAMTCWDTTTGHGFFFNNANYGEF